jgi:alkanesulfonate monooxygenase SsuD/methylene tetrahydromethanopterin reductase-like flavin-dependent oxidoreductase (luciferase family)
VAHLPTWCISPTRRLSPTHHPRPPPPPHPPALILLGGGPRPSFSAAELLQPICRAAATDASACRHPLQSPAGVRVP